MVTKVNVAVTVADQNGDPVSDGRVTALLSHTDIDSGAGYIFPERVEGTTDENGQVTLGLWPNELGSTASVYQFMIENPDTGMTQSVIATIPNSNCHLHLVADLPAYPGKTDGQLMIDEAIAAVAPAVAAKDAAIAAQSSAETAATNAENSASAAGTSEANAGNSAAAAANNASSASGSATTATMQAETATTKATEASNSATAAAGSETAAANSAASASGSATTATGAATTATTKASEAAASATAAAGFAANAGNSATSAGNSATAAEGSASAASTSESNAADSATLAGTNATTAVTARTAAEAARDQAALSAEEAKIAHFIGEVRQFAFGITPAGWLDCDGTVYNVADYPFLFTKIGNIYGGDGVNTFAVPNMSSKFATGAALGSTGGGLVALEAANLPQHTHTASFNVSTDIAQTRTAVQDGYLSGVDKVGGVGNGVYGAFRSDAGTGTVPINGVEVDASGSVTPTPVETTPPYLGFKFCIAATAEASETDIQAILDSNAGLVAMIEELESAWKPPITIIAGETRTATNDEDGHEWVVEGEGTFIFPPTPPVGWRAKVRFAPTATIKKAASGIGSILWPNTGRTETLWVIFSYRPDLPQTAPLLYWNAERVLQGGPSSLSASGVFVNTLPAALGASASTGTAYTFSRSDHVHPRPTATELGLATVATSGSYNDLLDKPVFTSSAITQEYLHVREEQSSGTAAQTYTGTGANEEITRTLNTVVSNTIAGASLASDTITLPAGSYYLRASASATVVANSLMAVIKNVTSGENILFGTSLAKAGAGGAQYPIPSVVVGRFTLSVESGIQMRNLIRGTAGTVYPLGLAAALGVNEIYSELEIWKVA